MNIKNITNHRKRYLLTAVLIVLSIVAVRAPFHGRLIRTLRDGNAEEATYWRGIRHGSTLYYNSSGKLIGEMNYWLGIRHGVYRDYTLGRYKPRWGRLARFYGIPVAPLKYFCLSNFTGVEVDFHENGLSWFVYEFIRGKLVRSELQGELSFSADQLARHGQTETTKAEGVKSRRRVARTPLN